MTTVEIRGRYIDPAGDPLAGHVKFTARPKVVYDQAAREFIVGQSRTVTLDGTGAFTVALQATDDPDLQPSEWTYEVREWVGSAWLRAPFDIDVPVVSSADGIELGDVAPVAAASGTATAYVTLAAFEGLEGRIDVLEADAAADVNSVDGRTGVVSLADRYDAAGAAAAAQAASVSLAEGSAWRSPLDRVTSLYAAAFPMTLGVPPTVTFHGPGGSTPITSPTLLPYDTALVTKIGCKPELRTQFGTNYWTNGVNGTWTAPPWAVEFVTDAADFAMRFRPETSAASFYVTVDGYPISRDPLGTGAFSGGSLYWMRLVFRNAVPRTVRVHMSLADFGGLDMPSTATTTAGVVTGKKVAFLGDSWTEGTSQAPYPHTWANVCARTFGWQPFLLGQGGTGYTTAGAGGGREKLGGTARLADLYSVVPDYVVVCGSQNDDGAATIQTEAAALYAALATNLPGVKVLVVGPQPSATTAARTTNRDAVRTAALAAPNVTAFIDPIAQSWITGTGKLTARTGVGNRDYVMGADSAHPSLLGGHYYGRRASEEILTAMLAAGIPY